MSRYREKTAFAHPLTVRRKMKHYIFFLFGILYFFSQPSLATSNQSKDNFWQEDVWKNPSRGFLYYGPNQQTNAKNQDKDLMKLDSVEKLQAEALARLKRAIMTPNRETLTSYLQVNHFLLKKSQDFAQSWKETLWELPQFDETVSYPKANFAQVALKEHKAQAQKQALEKLREDFALIFVIQANCPYCEMMAPVNQFIEQNYGLKTLAVFMGTTQPATWPHAKPDNGILRRLVQETGTTIEQTPAVFLVQKNGSAQLIASGALSAQELIERFLIIAQSS